MKGVFAAIKMLLSKKWGQSLLLALHRRCPCIQKSKVNSQRKYLTKFQVNITTTSEVINHWAGKNDPPVLHQTKKAQA